MPPGHMLKGPLTQIINPTSRMQLVHRDYLSPKSGVSGESLVWSPCSSLSYSPPPILSDLEDDLPSDGIPPPSPPQSSPSSPTEEVSNSSSCHVTRLSHSVVTNLSSLDAESHHLRHQESHTPLKDRPPDLVSSRTRRKSSGLTSPRLSRKRGADKAISETARPNGMVKCNGEVTTEPALLARLSGLSDEDDRGHFGSSRGKDLREKIGHSPRSGHMNGLRRSQQDSFRLKETQQQQRQEEHLLKGNLNNNISDENDRCLPSSLSSLMASFPSSLSSSSSSSSSSSGLGSSLNGESSSSSFSSSLTPTSSGTSTPTLSSSPSSKPAPKVRFPPPEKKDPGDVCRWRGCGAVLDQSSSLLEHIQAVHVEGQLEAESFRCLWVGCKVFDRASCSVSWLERHVLTHGGQKPFKCIVDGCGHRFRSQTALGRHVNHHFSSPAAAPAPRPQNQSSPVKLLRKNGRKLRYRKRPWSDTQGKPIVSRVFDFFDLSTMEKVRWGLMCSVESQVALDASCNYVNFTSQVLCKRRNLNGETEVLVRWSPNDILPDEWMNVEDLQDKCSVPFHKLSPEGQTVASHLFCPSLKRPSPNTNKRKRSPHKRANTLVTEGRLV